MTRGEAIQMLKALNMMLRRPDGTQISDACNALDMAIEALSKPNKAVPPSLADVYKWERDIAVKQLEEYGIGFGEKKRDMVELVRCNDCKWYDNRDVCHNPRYGDGHANYSPPYVDEEYWCKDGERREP